MRTIDAFNEFVEFLEGYELESALSQVALKKNIKKVFKKYYSIIVLSNHFHQSIPWKDKKKAEIFLSYFKEAVSDICQSLFLASQGLYKPAYLCLRSGVENIFRCIGLSQDQAVLSLTSVFELIDLVGDTDLVKKGVEAKKAFRSLRGEYSALCGFVHTTSSSHMAQTDLVGVFPQFIAGDAERIFSRISKVCQDVTILAILISPRNFYKLHHRLLDDVCNSLPATFKRSLSG